MFVAYISFFLGKQGKSSKTPPAQCGAESSVRHLLTKNPACSFSCPSQVRGISLPAALAVAKIAAFASCTLRSLAGRLPNYKTLIVKEDHLITEI